MEKRNPATTKKTTKPAVAKTGAKGKQPKAPPGADKKSVLRDQFGFGLETRNHKFGEMLQRGGGCTMKEVREAAWNTKDAPYYNTFKSLVAKSLAEKKPDGRMYATTQARNTAKNPA